MIGSVRLVKKISLDGAKLLYALDPKTWHTKWLAIYEQISNFAPRWKAWVTGKTFEDIGLDLEVGPSWDEDLTYYLIELKE